MEDPTAGKSASADYTVIYYIHADADYLYHDSEGNPVRDNRKVLETAIEVAEEATSGEVFIFYQRSERGFLKLFSRRESKFYHYLNGDKVHQLAYRHSNKESSFLSMEASLYEAYRVQEQDGDGRQYFLYFGHEIPSYQEEGYHRSLPAVRVGPHSLADGLQEFRSGSPQPFDLTVLSTCNNGTSAMVRQLLPHTRYLLASPQNLHLSHIDSGPLKLLNSNPDISTPQLADTLADRTYQRLQHKLHTAITLSLYDMDKVSGYIDDLYTSLQSVNNGSGDASPRDNLDCAQLSFFEEDKYQEGVTVWYDAAQFGRNPTQTSHSGWGCSPTNVNW